MTRNMYRIRGHPWCSDMISVTKVVEYVFCPRFTYYESVMGLPQYQQKRGTVKSGKEHHTKASSTNRTYVPAHISGNKVNSLKMVSKKHEFVGIVDHAIISDDEIVIIERKKTKFKKIYPTLKVQLGLLAILLEENVGKPVNRAQVIFSGPDNREDVMIGITDDVRNFALLMLNRAKDVIHDGTIPDTMYGNKCVDCCYRKICDIGSLNSLE